MASVDKGNLLKEMRRRKQCERVMLMRHSVTLSRIENRKQSPRAHTYAELMNNMDMPVGTLFCPFLEGQTLDVYALRARLLYLFINRAVNMLEMGEKEKSVPYFALAYYGSILMGRPNDKKAIDEYVKERLGIIFD